MRAAASREGALALEARQGPAGFDLGRLRGIRPRDYAVRFAFGALISVVAALATDLWGPRVGGLFLAFPAILPATATLLEKKEGLGEALSDIRGATLGAVGMIAFGSVVAAVVRHSAPVALGGALLAWMVVSGAAYLAMRGTVRLLGERQYLPEIPTSEAAALMGALMARRLTVATAESCSGGMLAALLASLPDAGVALRGGVVAYAEDVKRSVLGVEAELLERHGAVSAQVVAAMAAGCRRLTGADVAIAISGVTGAGTPEAPAGLTYVGVLAAEGRLRVRRFEGDIGPGRNDERAVRMALAIATAVVEDPEVASDRLPGAEAAPAVLPAPR